MRNAAYRRTFMRANAWLCTAVALTFGSFYLTFGAWGQVNSSAGAGHGAAAGPGAHSSGMGSHSSGVHSSGGFGNGHASHGYSGARSYGYSQNSSQNPYGPPRPSFELPGTSHPTIELPGNPLQTSPAKGSRHQYGYRAGSTLPWGYDSGFYPGYVNTGVPYGVPYGYDDEQLDTQAQGAPQEGSPAYDQGQRQPYASPENAPPEGQEPPYGGSAYGEAGRPPYGAPSYANAAPENTGPVTDGLEHPELTLIFNNGRPPQKIKSYAVTKTTLFALEGSHQRRIPISELDVPATVEKNRENGVEFSVPGTPN
ncbi:MAG: hypothetical protein ACR2JE_16750 [Acidobacteriaceae bacterium]